jgi:hypothetical protein
MPKHERKGLMFRFEKSPGVWGEWIVVPTGGGGGGRDDKLTDLQQQLVEIGNLIRTQGDNSNKFIKTVDGVLQWDTLDGSDINLSSPPAIGGTTPAAGTFTTLTATGQTLLGGASGAQTVQINTTTNSGQYTLFTRNNSINEQQIFTAGGSGSNLGFSSSGLGDIWFRTNSGGQTQARIAHTASAVNFVQVTGAATGGFPTISAQGSDANVGLNINTKGTNGIGFNTGGGTQMDIINVASTAAFIRVAGAASGNAPSISAAGLAANIPLVLQPKGTGALQAQQTDSTATGGNARGPNAVDWQTVRNGATQVASGQYATVSGGYRNTASGFATTISGGEINTSSGFISTVGGGSNNTASGTYATIAGGYLNTNTRDWSFVGSGYANTAVGYHNFIGAGFANSGTANAAVTTQATTAVTSGSTAVTLSGSNASIRVGQLITGTGINSFPNTYVAAISGTSLTLSQAANATGTPTLSFFTPHGVVVGGGNNQATGSYSFIGGGGDAGTAGNRNVASGDWSVVVGGRRNTASGPSAFVGAGGDISGAVFGNTASGVASAVVGGFNNTASGYGGFVGGGSSNVASATYSGILGGTSNSTNSDYSSIIGGNQGTTRSIIGSNAQPYCNNPLSSPQGASQGASLVLAVQTTDATATVLRSNTSAAGTTNQVILPNNSAYFFRGEVVAGVTGGGNTRGWVIEGVIKRGANAASTALVGTPTVTSSFADAGASTWVIAVTADTTNGGLRVTFTGQAGTTIRTVAKIETTEMTF